MVGESSEEDGQQGWERWSVQCWVGMCMGQGGGLLCHGVLEEGSFKIHFSDCSSLQRYNASLADSTASKIRCYHPNALTTVLSLGATPGVVLFSQLFVCTAECIPVPLFHQPHSYSPCYYLALLDFVI